MNEQMHYGKDYHFLPITSLKSGAGLELNSDIYCFTTQIVNVVFVGHACGNWTLVDAGLPKSAKHIIAAAEKRFGRHNKPDAIILTHGHFDHVGGIIELVEYWDVPVYAHELELQYLTGKSSYPSPDSTVSSGLIAKLSPFYPNDPIDLGENISQLPDNNSVPTMPEWRWIHTPGHTPGHVSLFRERDRTLIVGDAFVTVKQENLYEVFIQKPEISGPPQYFTTDWQSAFDSVKSLKALNPAVAITGHGVPFTGEELTHSLKDLVRDFDRIAVPKIGKYLN